jgi:hypothetical protein
MSLMAAAHLLPLRAAAARPAENDEARADSPVSFSYGFKGGVSFAQHTGIEERNSEYTVKSHWRTGYAAGAFLYVPVTARFGIQQEIMYVQKGSRQEIGVEILDIPTVLDVTYDMDYIEIPVFMKFALLQRERIAVHSVAGTALALMVRDHYSLAGEIDDGSQTVPLSADADMSEVDMFDYSFVYGFDAETTVSNLRAFLEYRFVIGWNTLLLPTYAYVPFGDESILIDNDPVPLKNQAHYIVVGIAF